MTVPHQLYRRVDFQLYLLDEACISALAHTQKLILQHTFSIPIFSLAINLDLPSKMRFLVRIRPWDINIQHVLCGIPFTIVSPAVKVHLDLADRGSWLILEGLNSHGELWARRRMGDALIFDPNRGGISGLP